VTIAANADVAGGSLELGAAFQQGLQLGLLVFGPPGELPGRLRLGDLRWLRGRPGFWSGRGPGIWFAQAGAVRGDTPPGGFSEVLPQVEPVGDLDRVRRAGAGTV
jgi:hypothetical protein